MSLILFRWFLWHQPTLSEYCFSYLKEHAQDVLQKHTSESNESIHSLHMIDDDDDVFFDCESTTPPTPVEATFAPEPAILTARAHWSSRRGTIELTQYSIRFVIHGGRTERSRSHTLFNLLELRKVTIPLTHLPPDAMPGVTKLTNETSALRILWSKAEKARLLRMTEEQPDAKIFAKRRRSMP